GLSRLVATLAAAPRQLRRGTQCGDNFDRRQTPAARSSRRPGLSSLAHSRRRPTARMMVLLAALLVLVPVHGVVLDTLPDRTAIVGTDEVRGMEPGGMGRYRFAPAAAFADGTNVDALMDGSTKPPTLRDTMAAARFAPGLPDSGKAVHIEPGSALPAATL